MQHVLVERDAGQVLQAVFALVLVDVARRDPSLCAAWAREISIGIPMVPQNPRDRPALLKNFCASSAPVIPRGQAPLPVITSTHRLHM
eukprot:4900789-Pyramimonas_sp.AAC.1